MRSSCEKGREQYQYKLLQLQHCDDAVPWQTSLALAERLESPNVAVILLKYGDHRLSSESDLARLGRTLDELVGEPPL